MNDVQGDVDIKMKLTIARDETPELHIALAAINEPRRRTRRLKDLAAKGLLWERSNRTLAAASGNGAQAMVDSLETMNRGVTDSVGSMLEWGGG